MLLEPLVVAHAAEMVEVLSSPTLYTVIGGQPPTEPELVAHYTRLVEGSPRPAETWRNWVIRHEGEAVGYVQATVDNDEAAAMLAWLVRPEAQGRGIATEAVVLAVDELRAGGVTTLAACIAPGHVASEAVARRIGFQPTDREVDGERVWTN